LWNGGRHQLGMLAGIASEYGSPALLVQAKQCKSRDAVEKERSFGLACHLLPVHGRGGA
jgi:hypothetical protein